MALAETQTRTPLRRAHDHLACAHQAAIDADDLPLADKIEKLWKQAEKKVIAEEDASSQIVTTDQAA